MKLSRFPEYAEVELNCTSANAIWEFCKQNVTDRMKVITRPHVAIMAGTKIGTGTFIEKNGVKVLTCAHVADCQPHAHYVDHGGSTEIQPGIWCADAGARSRCRIRSD